MSTSTEHPEWGTQAAADWLKAQHRPHLCQAMPTLRDGKVVCSKCGREYERVENGWEHPEPEEA